MTLPLLRADDCREHPAPALVRLAAVQMDFELGRPDRNVPACLNALHQAADAGATLVVFPECALTGYCFADADQAMEAALGRDDAHFVTLQRACAERGVSVVIGYLERDQGHLANSAAVLDGDGWVANYRKTHLPYLGSDRWVSAGDQPFEIVETAGLRLGVLICYDASFPEATRTLTMRGADLVVLPTNWPAEAIVKADWLPNTRAYENVIYFASVNRVGTEASFEFHGKSRVCSPTGDTLVQGPVDQEAILLADVDPARARSKRIERRGSDYYLDRIADRRPDLYDLGD